jgi:hypothetical protein
MNIDSAVDVDTSQGQSVSICNMNVKIIIVLYGFFIRLQVYFLYFSSGSISERMIASIHAIASAWSAAAR